MGKHGEQFPAAYFKVPFDAQQFGILSPADGELRFTHVIALDLGKTGKPGVYLCPPRQTWSSDAPRPTRTRHLCHLLNVLLGLLLCGWVVASVLFCDIHLTIDNSYTRQDSLWPTFFPRSHEAAESKPDSDVAPKLIPRIIHQTYKAQRLPEKLAPLVHTWREYNGHWQTRFYDDAACREFVSREFPQYLAAYISLPKHVERSDFFRYMVILREGGVYADIDVECRQPLDPVIRASDTMVVGYEAEVATDSEAFRRHFTRKRQVLQWFFAAAPGHPVLKRICDHINSNALTKFSNNTNRDTLEKTGPGIWTDIVLQHAMAHPASKADDPWKVRILPRVAFGVHPAGIDNLTPDAKEIIVLHNFLGSWKVRGGWQKWSLRKFLRKFLVFVPWARHSLQEDAPEEAIKTSGVPFFPVSTAFEPPFTMMVDLVGHGDTQSGHDVCSTISSWGTWQAALAPTRGPDIVNTLISSLSQRPSKPMLVDIGAAQGFFSLAAAARGLRVLAFEASERSLRPFNTSIEFNGFNTLIQLQNLSLGAVREPICLQPRGDSADGPVTAETTNTARGYGSPSVHALPASQCMRMGLRVPAWEVLGNNTGVGAVRISANGWEGAVVDGLLPYLQHVHKPGVIFVELHPALMRAAGYKQPTQLLQTLHGAGYIAAHAGYVCDERWYNVTRDVRARGSYTPEAQKALVQPTWCRLNPEDFHIIEERAHEEVPENVLFVYQAPVVPPGAGGQSRTSSGPPELHAERLPSRSLQPGQGELESLSIRLRGRGSDAVSIAQ